MADRNGLGGIFLSIQDKLAQAVSSIVPPKDIEDIVQETYVRVCQVDHDYTINHPRSFLFKTARNLALDHVKRAETRLVSSVEEELNLAEDDRWDDEIFEQVASKQEFAYFCEAIRQLPVQCRRAFVLKKVYGYSQKEISKELGIAESTVEKHIALGMKRCTYYMMSKSYINADQRGKCHSVSKTKKYRKPKPEKFERRIKEVTNE